MATKKTADESGAVDPALAPAESADTPAIEARVAGPAPADAAATEPAAEDPAPADLTDAAATETAGEDPVPTDPATASAPAADQSVVAIEKVHARALVAINRDGELLVPAGRSFVASSGYVAARVLAGEADDSEAAVLAGYDVGPAFDIDA